MVFWALSILKIASMLIDTASNGTKAIKVV